MAIAFITGATSGFGKAIALNFAAHGWQVIACGRRKEKLVELENEIVSAFSSKILTLDFDIQDKVAVRNALESVPHEWKAIDVLVNNAGLASGLAPIQEGEIADWEAMVNTNVMG